MSLSWMAVLVVLIVLNQSFHRSRGLVGSPLCFRIMVSANLSLILCLAAWPWLPGVSPLPGLARLLVGMMIAMHIATAFQARSTLVTEAARDRAEEAWAAAAKRIDALDDE